MVERTYWPMGRETDGWVCLGMWVERGVNGRVDGRKDGRGNGRMDGRTGGRMGGHSRRWLDRCRVRRPSGDDGLNRRGC